MFFRSPDICVAAVNWLPLGGHLTMGDFLIDGGRARSRLNVDKLCVSPGYFRTMGIPQLKGRDFDENDAADVPPVAIVNDTRAPRLKPPTSR